MEDVLRLLPPAAWVLAAASLILTAFLGLVLAYHWYRYAMSPAVSTVAAVVYIAVSAMLLSGMFGALIMLPGTP